MQNTDETYLHSASTQTLSLAVEEVPLSAFLSACTMLLTAYIKHKASQVSTETSLMTCSAPLSRADRECKIEQLDLYIAVVTDFIQAVLPWRSENRTKAFSQ